MGKRYMYTAEHWNGNIRSFSSTRFVLSWVLSLEAISVKLHLNGNVGDFHGRSV